MPNDRSGIRVAGGIVIEDPLRGAPAGTRIEINPSLFACKVPGPLEGIFNWEFFEGAVVALHFGQSGTQRILGSGVMVAPGVVMAARHVISAQEELLTAGEQELICSGITPDGLVIWRCQSVTIIGNTDIAFLIVEAASAIPSVLRQVTLTTRMPRIGEEIVIVGFRHEAQEPVNIDDPAQLAMLAASGEVTARYEHRRDGVLLPFPCFEVNCGAKGGMSGGPAFDKSGFLVGLITSSLAGESEGPTFVTLPWPAFAETIEPMWPTGFYEGPTSLLNIDRRVCGIHRPEAIEIRTAEYSGLSTTVYHHWDAE